VLAGVADDGDLDAGGEQEVQEVKVVASQVLELVDVDLVEHGLQTADDGTFGVAVGLAGELRQTRRAEAAIAIEVVQVPLRAGDAPRWVSPVTEDW
jgi:hypothetical protein